MIPNRKHMSVNRRKQLALNAIKNFEGIPSRGLLSTLAGVHRNTLLDWEKKDEQFSDELADILEKKKLTRARKQADAIKDGPSEEDRAWLRETIVWWDTKRDFSKATTSDILLIGQRGIYDLEAAIPKLKKYMGIK